MRVDVHELLGGGGGVGGVGGEGGGGGAEYVESQFSSSGVCARRAVDGLGGIP